MATNFNQMVNSLKTEADKIQVELKKWSASVKPQAQTKIKDLEGKYKSVVKQLHDAQKELHVELMRTMKIVKKHQAKLKQTLGSKKKTTKKRTTKKSVTA